MGRAIVRNPQVFCMDEPLSNLDAKMRVQTRTDIAKLQADLGVTTVYVTHDQVEAMTMGDRVAVMKLGELQQVDTPLKLYDKPVNLFVAGFIGSPQMNLIEATAVEGQAKIGEYLVPVDPTASKKMQGNITVGVRPEAWRLVSAERGRPAGHGDRGRGARRRRLRLRHLRRRGHARATSSSGSPAATPCRRATRST